MNTDCISLFSVIWREAVGLKVAKDVIYLRFPRSNLPVPGADSCAIT